MTKLGLRVGITILGLFIIGYGVIFGWVWWTTDLYFGKITQPPKITTDGEREIGLLPPGEKIAHTINIENFCLMPFTNWCRLTSADYQNTFQVGENYCLSAYGFRWGMMSIKPNMLELLEEEDCAELIRR